VLESVRGARVNLSVRGHCESLRGPFDVFLKIYEQMKLLRWIS
jgi:hypothetical protein